MTRVGFGYDLHRLVPGRPLVLGGIDLGHEKGLLGHSDGDVLLHALMDALLGALSLGDIGQLFPDSDPRYKGISSLKLLGQVKEKICRRSTIVNVDATVVCQEPKLGPHFGRMKETIASVLDLHEDRISLKATTTEGLGPEGVGDAISAYAVALLKTREDE